MKRIVRHRTHLLTLLATFSLACTKVDCFSPETRVLTPRGKRRLSRIRVGDCIETGLGTCCVGRIHLAWGPIFRVTTDIGRILVSSSHPFATAGGWKQTADLRAGTRLLDLDGYVLCRGVELVGEGDLINLEVEGVPTFIAEGLVVHNKTVNKDLDRDFAPDCDETDPEVNYDHPEVCDDGKDNNCNDLVDTQDTACQTESSDTGIKSSDTGNSGTE